MNSPKLLAAAIAALALVAAQSSHAGVPDAPAYRLTGSYAGPDGGWDLAGVDPGTGRLYVARSYGMMAVDLGSSAVTPTLFAGGRGHAAYPIPGTQRVLFTDGTANTATILDGATGAPVAVLPTGKRPDAVAYDPATRTLWVMNPGEGTISVVDPEAAKVVGTVQVGGSLELAVADGRGRMFVNVEDRNEVVVLDTRKRAVERRFPLNGCDGPTGIAYAPETDQLLSACANKVAVVSTPDGRGVASLEIGPHADGALYDAARGVALVPTGGDGMLSVIRMGAKPQVVARVKTGEGARTAALDPATGRIYLPSAKFAPAAKPGERPAMIPGSFAVLVVSPDSR